MNWLETQPLHVTTLIVVSMSAVAALLWGRIQSKLEKWTLALVGPFLIAWCLALMPVWFGAQSSEYGTWWPVLVMLWGIPAAFVSMGVVYLGDRLTRRRHDARIEAAER
jgi:hypothetical protein